MAQLALALAIGLLAVAVLVGGVGCLLAALWLAVGETNSPAAAAFWTGVAALTVGVLIGAVAYIASRREHPASKLFSSLSKGRGTGPEGEIVAKLAAVLGQEAATLISAHPGRAAISALALGFVVGANPHLREALREVLDDK